MARSCSNSNARNTLEFSKVFESQRLVARAKAAGFLEGVGSVEAGPEPRVRLTRGVVATAVCSGLLIRCVRHEFMGNSHGVKSPDPQSRGVADERGDALTRGPLLKWAS